MLVLSRRLNEKIILPTVPATVQVVALKPGVVRLGIQAPDNVPVFREEVMAAGGGAFVAEPPTDLRKLNHLIRNRLNAAGVGLSLLRLQSSQDPRAADVLDRIEKELRELQEEIGVLSQPKKPAAVKPTRRALLVEDNQNERELLSAFLRMADFDVDTAGDGADALDYLQATRPDFVLLDMMLPRCDGATMLRTLRRDPSYNDLKVFAISGYPPEQLGIDADKAGIDRWFQKPINAEALLGELREQLTPGAASAR